MSWLAMILVISTCFLCDLALKFANKVMSPDPIDIFQEVQAGYLTGEWETRVGKENQLTMVQIRNEARYRRSREEVNALIKSLPWPSTRFHRLKPQNGLRLQPPLAPANSDGFMPGPPGSPTTKRSSLFAQSA